MGKMRLACTNHYSTVIQIGLSLPNPCLPHYLHFTYLLYTTCSSHLLSALLTNNLFPNHFIHIRLYVKKTSASSWFN